MPALRKYEIRYELKDTNLNKHFYQKNKNKKQELSTAAYHLKYEREESKTQRPSCD